MKKNKPPVLTSPSKIGFFVSLLVVFVSLGVAYFFSRRFGIDWNLLERDWLDRNEWLGVLRGEGFLFEVLPLVGLVAVTSMFAFLVISGAVRKYKRYLDSGHDYRNLLASLKDVEDLEDKKKIERIKNHPELKRLLLGLAENIEERERTLGEREGALETRLEESLRTKESELAEAFSQECDRLARAFESGSVEPSAIEFSNPGLRRLAEIAGRAGQRAEQEPRRDLAGPYGDMRKTSDVLQSKLREIAAELRTGCEGAQEIESRVRRLASREREGAAGVRPETARGEIRAIVESLGAIERVNLTVDSLSEEARGIAINTALHAGSGTGTQEDLIRLAEEIKDLAARFKEAARQFAQTSSAVRRSIGTLDSVAGKESVPSGGSAAPEEDLAGILTRVSLWVERTLVLTDKVSNVEKSFGVSIGALPEASEEAFSDRSEYSEEPVYGEPPVEEPASGEDFAFESLERSRLLFGDKTQPPPEDVEARPGLRRSFEDVPSEIVRPFGAVEPEREAPAEPARGSAAASAGATPEPTAEEPAAAKPGAWETDAAETEVEAPEAAEPGTAEPPRRGRPVEELAADGRGAGERPEGPEDLEEAEEPEAAETAEEAVDLYALGAVDYDPALHG